MIKVGNDVQIGCTTVVNNKGSGKFSAEVVVTTEWGKVVFRGPTVLEHFYREFSAARDEYYTMRERIKQVECTQQEDKDDDA